jgi:hypothetical protein
MNGVSRFLSRRDKHHKDRQPAKPGHNKVRKLFRTPHYPRSPCSPPPTAIATDGAASLSSPGQCRRRTDSLHSLYHQLPACLQPVGGDGFLFLKKKASRAHLTALHVHVSTCSQSSDRYMLQSPQDSTDLYTIFTNEEAKPSEKDDEKKVGESPKPVEREC